MRSLESIQAFRQSEGFKLFVEDYKLAKTAAQDAICTITPKNIEDLAVQEQLKGQVEQIVICLDWFEAKEQELTKLLKTNDPE